MSKHWYTPNSTVENLGWTLVPTGGTADQKVDDDSGVTPSSEPTTHDSSTTTIKRGGGLAGTVRARFDFTDSIPSGSSINFVTIKFRQDRTSSSPTIKTLISDGTTNSYGPEVTDIDTYTVLHSNQFNNNPTGGSWALSDIPGLQFGVEMVGEGGFKTNLNITSIYIEIDYTPPSSNHPIPTSLEADHQTTPTNVSEDPVFTAIAHRTGGVGTFDQIDIEVYEDTGYATLVAFHQGITLSTTVADNVRSAVIRWDDDGAAGNWTTLNSLSSDPPNGVYYWRVRFRESVSGDVSGWSDNDVGGNMSQISGINRVWANSSYAYRRKLTFLPDHAAIAANEYTAKFDFQTGNRISIAQNGDFNEAVQASGGFSIDTFGSKTHVVYLSTPGETSGYLETWIVTLDRSVTPHVWGTPIKINEVFNQTFDTHFFPVISVDDSGYIHVMTSGHNRSMQYTRSELPNVSGSLAGETASWIRPSFLPTIEAGFDGLGGTATYPVMFFNPTDGQTYCGYRIGPASGEGRYVYIRTTDATYPGKTWSPPYTLIDDITVRSVGAEGEYRIYGYGQRYDRVNKRWHLAFTVTRTKSSPIAEKEKGVWYIYSDFDETDGSSLNVGFNLWRRSDGTLVGRLSADANNSHINGQLPVINFQGWSTFASDAMILSNNELTSNLVLSFIETLVLDKNGQPIIFWEQKFVSGAQQASNAFARETSLLSAKWSANIGQAGSWNTSKISDQVNHLLRVRRSSLSAMTDLEGIIHAWWPVAAKTYWHQYPISDTNSTGTITKSTGTEIFSLLDDGYSQADETTYIDMVNVATFRCGNNNDIASEKQIIRVDIECVAKIVSGTPDLQGLIFTPAQSEQLGSAIVVPSSTDWALHTWSWETNPWTTNAWTPAEVNALEFGLKQSDAAATARVCRCTIRVYWTVAANSELVASEIFHFKSVDGGTNWELVKELSRNTTVGVPIMNHKHHLTQGQMEIIWTSGLDVFYLQVDPFGKILDSGVDLRIYKQSFGVQTQIDRVMDYANKDMSTIRFKVADAIALNKKAATIDYYMYYGNANETVNPLSDPNNVYFWFESWETWKENDTINGVSGWTSTNGRIYQSPPENPTSGDGHANKMGAGMLTLEHTTSGESSKVPFTNLTDVLVEAITWPEYLFSGSGDTFYSTPVFTGTGTDTFSVTGAYSGIVSQDYEVKIVTDGNPDQFQWRKAGGAWSGNIDCTFSTTIDQGVIVHFTDFTGNVLNDLWTFTAQLSTPVALLLEDGAGNQAGFGQSVNEQAVLSPDGIYWKDADGIVLENADILLRHNTMFTLGLSFNSQGITLYANEKVVYYDYDTGVAITDFDKLVLRSVRKAYIDFIRVTKKLEKYVITSVSGGGLTKDGITFDTLDFTSAKKFQDGYHDFAEVLVRRVKVTVSARIQETISPSWPETVTLKVWIATGAVYDGANAFDSKDVIVTLNNINRTAGTPVEWLNLRGGAYSIKVDSYATSYTGEELIESWIDSIDIYNTDNSTSKEPVINIGSEEVRGFFFNVSLQGAGRTVFLSSFDVSQNTRRFRLPLPIESLSDKQNAQRFPVETLLDFVESRQFPIEAIGNPTFTFKIPVEYTQNRQFNSQLQVEYLQGVKRIAQIPVEYAGTVKRTFGIPVEYGESRQASRRLPIEYTVVNPTISSRFWIDRTSERVILPHFPVEYSGFVPVGTYSFPIEYGGGIAHRAKIPIETVLGVDRSSSFPIEVIVDVIRNSQINIEYVQSRIIASQIPIESAGAFSRSAQIPVEYALAAENLISRIQIEYRASLAQSYSFPVETLLDVSYRAQIPVEYGTINEALSALFPVEYRAGLSYAGQIPIEYGGIAAIGVYSFPVEYAGSVSPIGLSFPVSYSGPLQSSFRFPVEYAQGSSHSAQIPVSYLGAFSQGSGFPVEYGGAFTPIKTGFPIEYGLSFRHKVPILIEYTQAVQHSVQTFIEYLGALSHSRTFPVEYAKLSGDLSARFPVEFGLAIPTITGTIPVEYLGSFQAGYQIPIEYISGVPFSEIYKIPIEILSAVVRDAQIPIESLMSRTSSRRLPIEYNVGYSEAGRFPVEYTGAVFIIGSFSFPIEYLEAVQESKLIPIEYGLGVQSNNTVNVEWTMSRVIRDSFAIEYGVAFRQAVNLVTEYLNSRGIKVGINVEYLSTKDFLTRFKIEYANKVVASGQFQIESLVETMIKHEFPIEWLGTVIAALIIKNAALRIPSLADPSLSVPSLANILAAVSQIKNAETKNPSLTSLALKVSEGLGAKILGGTGQDAT